MPCSVSVGWLAFDTPIFPVHFASLGFVHLHTLVRLPPPPQVLAMGDILPGGSVRDPAGRLTLDWLAVYRECARPSGSRNQRTTCITLAEFMIPAVRAGMTLCRCRSRHVCATHAHSVAEVISLKSNIVILRAA